MEEESAALPVKRIGVGADIAAAAAFLGRGRDRQDQLQVAVFRVPGKVLAGETEFLATDAGHVPVAPGSDLFAVQSEGDPEGGIVQRAQNAPLRIIVPFSAGSGTDTSARMLAEAITKTSGRTAIVENKPGAGNPTTDDRCL